jgi:putative ABC transport system substrate-binding protein
VITRRQTLFALGAAALALPHLSFAQTKVRRVCILGNMNASDSLLDAFTLGLRELGYVEGKNVIIERHLAEGDATRLDVLAADLVRQKPDVIFAPNSISLEAAKKAAGTIPIVFAVAGDPVGAGFVASLARPGGSITGTTNITQDLSAKRLQILKQAAPKISRVAVLDPGDSVASIRTQQFEEVQRAAKVFGMQVLHTQLLRREDFEPVSAQLRKWRADSMYFVSSPTNTYNRALLVEFSTKMRLPAVYADKVFSELGGFISYGPSFEALYRRAATYVDKVLKGARPADLPVEQPTKFEMVINVRTAKALGVAIPQSILVQATKVIE